MSVADMSLNAIANLEYESVKHLAPTFHGDTLYSESKVLEKTESTSKPDRGVLTVETRCWNQRDETVMTPRRRILTPKRDPYTRRKPKDPVRLEPKRSDWCVELQ